jgi:hypothetical protein
MMIQHINTINVIQHNNIFKDKNGMMISINAEIAVTKFSILL